MTRAPATPPPAVRASFALQCLLLVTGAAMIHPLVSFHSEAAAGSFLFLITFVPLDIWCYKVAVNCWRGQNWSRIGLVVTVVVLAVFEMHNIKSVLELPWEYTGFRHTSAFRDYPWPDNRPLALLLAGHTLVLRVVAATLLFTPSARAFFAAASASK